MEASPSTSLALALTLALFMSACDPDDGTEGYDTQDGLITTPHDTVEDDSDESDVTDDTSEEGGEDGGGTVACTAEGEPCNDGLACTTDDLCTEGVCAGTPVYTDGLDCTLNCSVLSGQPVEVLVVLTGCAIDGSCWADGTISPTNPCEMCSASRDDSGWSPLADGTLCTDNDPCTEKPECIQGICTGTSLFDDGDPCTADCAVDLSGDAIEIQENYPEGTACSDGNACTTNDICLFGACLGTTLDCDDNNACTLDACSEGTCTHANTNEGIACDDDDACTLEDVCLAGACTGNALDCTPEDPCDDGWCTSLGCVYTEKFEDGNPCTTNCALDTVGAPTEITSDLPDGSGCVDPSTCSDSPECQAGACVATGAPCDDGNSDTEDACTDGECISTPTG